jgi:hypothetical protein
VGLSVHGLTKARENEIHPVSSLYLASLEKGTARQLFDAAMAWPPIRELVEKHAKV